MCFLVRSFRVGVDRGRGVWTEVDIWRTTSMVRESVEEKTGVL